MASNRCPDGTSGMKLILIQLFIFFTVVSPIDQMALNCRVMAVYAILSRVWQPNNVSSYNGSCDILKKCTYDLYHMKRISVPRMASSRYAVSVELHTANCNLGLDKVIYGRFGLGRKIYVG